MTEAIKKLTQMNTNGSQLHPEYLREIKKRSGRSDQAVQTAVLLFVGILSFINEEFFASNKLLFVDEFFICGYGRLMEHLSFSEKQVREASRLLENIGLVIIEYRPVPSLGKTKHIAYHINLDMLATILGYDIANIPSCNQPLPSESPMDTLEVTPTLPDGQPDENIYLYNQKRDEDDEDVRARIIHLREEYQSNLDAIKCTALQSDFPSTEISGFMAWIPRKIYSNGTIPIGHQVLQAAYVLDGIARLSVQDWNDIHYRMSINKPSAKGWNAYLLSSLHRECMLHDSLEAQPIASTTKPIAKPYKVVTQPSSIWGYKTQQYDFAALQKFINEN